MTAPAAAPPPLGSPFQTLGKDSNEPRGELRVSRLSYEVDRARLLTDVNLSVSCGELVGLIGPNGAGKSTLLRNVAGLAKPTAGSVLVEGHGTSGRSPREVARRLAFVTQSPPPTHGFTALEIVLTGRYPHLGRLEIEGAHDLRVALACMEVTDTLEFAGRVAATLSGGELQRVFFARALAQQPAILILDEPTASLDVLHQISVFELLRRLSCEGMTVLVAAHDLQLAARYCSRLVLLSEGVVIADGPPASVLTPENLASAFRVEAVVYPDPVSGELAIHYRGAIAAKEQSNDLTGA